MTTDEMLQVLREGFVEEASELVAEATRAVLSLERPPDVAGARRIHDGLARQLHTLKGSAATVGLDEPSRLAHALEDLLAPARKAGAALPAVIVDVVLRSLELLLERVRAESRDGAKPELSPAFARIEAAANGMLPEPTPTVMPPAPVESVKAPETVAEPLATAAVAAEPIDPAASADEGEGALRSAWRVSADDVRALVREVEHLRELRLRIAARVGALGVLAEKLGKMEGASELQARVDALGAESAVDVAAAESSVHGLEDIVRRVGTVRLDLLREPLRRAIRQVALETGKQVRLGFVGEGEAVDRRVVEALRGPLVHLVRNSVVHGIEAPELRSRRGKHPEGTVTLRFVRDGNMLVASVEDDGGGVDLERLRAAARASGVDDTGLDDAAALRLVFRSGLSTASSVTNAAGRGVGLDVVRAEVAALGGTVDVHSRAGQGARFTARLPIEIGSSNLLVLRAGEQEFGLPASAVRGVATVRPEEIVVSRGRSLFVFRDQPLPATHLGGAIGLSAPKPLSAGQSVVVLQSADRSVALVVEALVGAEDLVIRPMPHELLGVEAFNGVATLGDGRLLLALRPEWLVDRPGESVARPTDGRLVLVVDDSLTARALHRTILESAGWSVHTVGDGVSALSHAASTRYDLVVCDIGMEGLDGFEVTKRLRATPGGAGLPVILVSAHDSDADRVRGLEAGADAFLSKRDCVSGRLISEVSALTSRRARGDR